MSVVVSDLVARVRAEGVQETTAAVRGAGASAEQTAKAFEIMAEKAAKIGGGTATQWLENFTRSGAQPTAAALAEAAKAADQTTVAIERTAAVAKASAASITSALSGAGVDPSGARVQSILAAQSRADQQGGLAKALESAGVSASVARQQAKGLTDETRAGADASQKIAEGFKLSESSVLRFGAGIAGVGLGLNLAAGAASLIHQAIVSVIDVQVDWERSVMRTNALYGTLAPNVVAVAQAQANAPGLLGTQQEFLSARLNASYLGTRYGVPEAGIVGLTSAAGAVSRAYGYDEARRRDLQARALAFAEGGGSSLRDITGTEGDPTAISRRIGGVTGEQLAAFTPQQLKTLQDQIATVDLYRTALSGQNNQGGLVRAQAEAQQALARAQSAVQNNLEASGGGYVQGPSTGQREITRSILEYGVQPQGQVPVGPGDVGLQKAVDAAKDAYEAATRAVKDNQAAFEEHSAALKKLGVDYGSATFRLLGVRGSVEDPYSLARGDFAAQTQAAVAQRSVGPNPLIARSSAEMAATARETAEQQARQSFDSEVNRIGQRNAGSGIREYLENQLRTGPSENRPAAQRALDEIQRRYLATTLGGQAQQASALAERSQTEAQAVGSAITLRQDERRLAVAQDLADLRKEALTSEGQFAPLIERQAQLQERMVVASRDDLNTRRQLITAQQATLAPQGELAQFDYTDRRAAALAQQRQGRLLLGRDVSDLPSFDELIQQHTSTVLNRAASGAEVRALDTQYNVDVIQRQRTGADLGRAATLTDLEDQGRLLQDQQIPLEQHLRLVQAKEQSIQRTVDLLNLEDTAEQTAAGRALNTAQQLALQASAADRSAGDLAANMDLGATNLERAANAAERTQVALDAIRYAGDQQKDVSARVDNGLGGGGIGPDNGTVSRPPSVTNTFVLPPITINGPSSEETQAIVQRELDTFQQRLREGLNRSRLGGPPASSDLAGSRR